ncbi:MAG: cell division protein FtsW [Deltaproteobacteria bacterium]|nr:cell division protein FtsW [Deltaproteobacteria bacterium]
MQENKANTMNQTVIKKKFSLDGWMLIFAALSLSLIGLIMVFSVTGGQILSKYFHSNRVVSGSLPETTRFFFHQGVFLLVGISVTLIAMSLPPEFYRKSMKLGLFGAVLLLVAVSVFGENVNGARRWFRMGSISLQPMEIAKVALIIYLGVILEKRMAIMTDLWKGFAQPLFVVGIMVFFLLLQPDLGSAILFVSVAAALLYIAGSRLVYFLLAGVVLLPFSWYYVAAGWRLHKRIIPFLHPEYFKQGAAYQIIRSLDAFGSGETMGWGLGNGPYKMDFLPEAHTDYIAAMIGQELGFLGISFLISMYVLILIAGIRIALRQRGKTFRMFVAAGITLMIVFQAIINLSVVMNLIPSKGITLPFVSYGGSSLLLSFASLGLLLSIDRYNGIFQPEKSASKKRKKKSDLVVAPSGVHRVTLPQ